MWRVLIGCQCKPNLHQHYISIELFFVFFQQRYCSFSSKLNNMNEMFVLFSWLLERIFCSSCNYLTWYFLFVNCWVFVSIMSTSPMLNKLLFIIRIVMRVYTSLAMLKVHAMFIYLLGNFFLLIKALKYKRQERPEPIHQSQNV